MTPTPARPRVLVVHASTSGCTQTIAHRIGMHLEGRGFGVAVAPATERPVPGPYDAVVVGSGIRAGRWHLPAVDWVADNAAALRRRPLATFSVCLSAAFMDTQSGRTETQRYQRMPVIDECDLDPVATAVFPGWNNAALKRWERAVMWLMRKPKGDFRDLAAVGRWADALPLGLPVELSGPRPVA